MFQKMDLFRLAAGMADHAGRRQTIAARNLANSDTPNFRAKDLVPFTTKTASGDRFRAWHTTRQGHMSPEGKSSGSVLEVYDDAGYREPNGNSVSVENELLRSVDIRRQHDHSIAIYRSTLSILRTSLGR